MIIRAIYRTTEDTHTGIRDLDNMSIEDRLYWLEKMLRDVRTFNLEELVGTESIANLERLMNDPEEVREDNSIFVNSKRPSVKEVNKESRFVQKLIEKDRKLTNKQRRLNKRKIAWKEEKSAQMLKYQLYR